MFYLVEYPTLLLLLHWQLINYFFFLFTFSPPHRPHVDPTANFYLNIASWIVKLYTITTTTTTTSTFLLFSLLLISIVSVWNGSLLTMECKRRKLKIGCPHCIGSFQWRTNWHFLCKSLTLSLKSENSCLGWLFSTSIEHHFVEIGQMNYSTNIWV